MRFRAVLVVLGALLAFLGASVLSERVAHAASTSDAPLCDERAASAYAAEPAPQPIDAGELARAPDAPCKAMLSSGSAVPSNDDLQRGADPEPHDSTSLVPPAPMLIPDAVSTDGDRLVSAGSQGDEHRRNDNPPPRPIPWRS